MIRQYRLKKKLSQEELAEEIGISWRHCKGWNIMRKIPESPLLKK
ncbi:MAG: helix-turn-helix domain-containing protein [Clostridia bacterium]